MIACVESIIELTHVKSVTKTFHAFEISERFEKFTEIRYTLSHYDGGPLQGFFLSLHKL